MRCLRPGVVLAGLSFAIAFGTAARTQAGEDVAARAYLADDMVKAEALLEAEIAAGDARPSRYLFLGRVCFRLGKWERAREVLEALLKKDPENPPARELLGQVLFRQGRFKEALPCYEASLGQAPRAELRLELGEVLIGLGRKTDALVQLTRVTEDSRAWPRAHYLLGGLRLESGLGHWAANHLWIAHRLGCQEKDLSLKLARAFHLEGRVTGPLFLAGPLKAGKAGERTDKDILVKRAELAGEGFWYAAGTDNALYQVEAAVAEAGGRVSDQVLLLAARCWLAAGNLERARHYADAVQAKSAEAFLLRAEADLAGEDLAGFGKLLEEWPAEGRPAAGGMVGPLVQAALLAQVKADPGAALKFLEKAEALSPGRSDVLRSMIDVLAQLKRREEAVGKARLLAELYPDSPEARLIASRYGIDFEDIELRGAPVMEDQDKGKDRGKDKNNDKDEEELP